jgi:hypothetical protein
MDATESVRRSMVGEINRQVESDSEVAERKRLEEQYGQVWNTQEVSADFTITGFMAPFVGVTRKSDGKTGVLMFQHSPRFYFDFVEGS